MSVVVIVPAAGVGSRFGGQIPKQFQQLNGKPIVQHVIERSVITAENGRLAIDPPAAWAGPAAAPERTAPVTADRVLTDAEVRKLEADNIRAALRQANGKVSGPGGAAERLGLALAQRGHRCRYAHGPDLGAATSGSAGHLAKLFFHSVNRWSEGGQHAYPITRFECGLEHGLVGFQDRQR